MFNSHVACSGETEQNLSSDIYLMFVTVLFVLVIDAEKLEVCIHKHNHMVEKVSLSENQFTNMTDDTVMNFHHNLWDLTTVQQTHNSQLWIWSLMFKKCQ